MLCVCVCVKVGKSELWFSSVIDTKNLSSPTKFEGNQISCLSENARELLHKPEAMEWQEFSGTWSKVDQAQGVPYLIPSQIWTHSD